MPVWPAVSGWTLARVVELAAEAEVEVEAEATAQQLVKGVEVNRTMECVVKRYTAQVARRATTPPQPVRNPICRPNAWLAPESVESVCSG